MGTKRLFVGTFISCSVFEDVYSGIRDEFEPVCSGKWVEPENLHFTYKFIGEVAESELPIIKQILGDSIQTYDSELILRGLGALPNARRPRVLFASVINPDRRLITLQKQIEATLVKAGFEPEERKFTPHITLLRVKQYDSGKFQNLLAKYATTEFGKMKQFTIDLIESILTQQRPYYKPLHDI